ncbi:non-ribosomal peptide synthetase [Micromonospora sp. CA-263727]|uniref:non-ribosomal peptide synthetase n=1 Tax=Micromonospora sp. CA-263727 TaxID=3239967 RepID=UPI003D8D5849
MSSTAIGSPASARQATVTPADIEVGETYMVSRAVEVSAAEARRCRGSERGTDKAEPGRAVVAWICGPLDPDLVRGAYSELIQRHEVLRSIYSFQNGRLLRQVVGEPRHDVVFRTGTGTDPAARERSFRDIVDTAARRGFLPAVGTLVRCVLVSWPGDEHALALIAHPVVGDSRFLQGLLRELLNRSMLGPREDAPPGTPGAEMADGRPKPDGERSEDLAFWRRELADSPQLALAADRPRPGVRRRLVAEVVRPVAPAAVKLLTEAASQAEAERLVLSAYAAVLARHACQEELVIGLVDAACTGSSGMATGRFSSLLPVRIKVPAGQTFAALKDSVSAAVRTAQQRRLPIEDLVEALEAPWPESHFPLFQAGFAARDVAAPVELGGARATLLELPYPRGDLDVLLSLERTAASPVLRLTYSSELFDEESAAVILDHVQSYLGSVATGAARPTMVDQAEAIRLTVDFNPGPPRRLAPQDSLLSRFEGHARATPDAEAVRHRGRGLTYAELNRQADQLAARLTEAGLEPGGLVGLCLDRSPTFMAAILAVWKVGAAYVPLDPAYPAHRLELIVRSSGVSLVLVEPATASRVHGFLPDATTLDITDISSRPARMPTAAAPRSAPPRPTDLAYVIYTSGSTGVPKGVMVAHDGLARLFQDDPCGLRVSATDVWLCVHSFSFDYSVWELWGALAFGARVVIATAEETRDPARLAALVQTEGVTVLNQTPGALYRLLPEVLPAAASAGSSLRYVFLGGEALSWSRLSDLLGDAEGIKAEFVNCYGITEGTVCVTEIAATAAGIPHLRENTVGRPIPSGRCYVLDADRQLAGIGVPGELYIGGPLVALGYLNQSELSESRFIPDPYLPTGSGSMYRTGDLARWTPDGELVYLGREDHQVQIRGHRVECAEVERAILRHPSVASCAVLADGEELLAFVTGSIRQQQRSGLLAQVRTIVPAYMVPNQIVVVDRIPLTAHGKVDRAALIAQRQVVSSVAMSGPPGESLEERIRALWVEVLGRHDVGLHENFFDAGGHSFSLHTLQARMTQIGFEIALPDIFRLGTIAALAAHLRGDAPALSPPGSPEPDERQRRAGIRALAARNRPSEEKA